MASGSIKGITIELNGDTTGLDKALKSISSESASLSKDLKTVNQLLKLDPGNAELLAQKQQILAQSISTTAEKLEILRGAQEEVKAQFERGEISREQYIAFQNELVRTEQRMNSLTDEQEQMQEGFDDSADSAEDTTGAVKDLGKEENTASKETSNLGESLKKGLVAGAKAAAAALAAATAAVTATVGGIVKATADTAQYGDEVEKMSQKVGMSAKAYQEWDYVMQISGTEMSAMTTGLKTLTNKLDDAKNGSESATAMFESLGLSMDDLAGMSREDVFANVITAFQGMEDSAERAALANDLFGKSGQDLAPLFNTSAEETQALIEKVNDLGGVMSDEGVKNSARFQDSMTNMKTAVAGAVRGITSDFMPALSDMMDGIAAIVSGDSGGIKMLEKGLQDFTNNLSELIPTITSTAERLVPVIIGAIENNLPTLLKAATDIIIMLAKGLIKALPKIVSAAGDIIKQLTKSLISLLPQILKVGLDIIKELAKGIVQYLPKLIPAIVDVVLEIVDVLIDNLDMLIDAAIEIIMALAQGIIDALPRLIEKAPIIIQKLVDAIVRNATKLLEAAWQLIFMLGKGIIQNLPQLVQSAHEIIGSLTGGIISLIGRVREVGVKIFTTIANSLKDLPSKAMQWGKDMLQGFVNGIKARISAITDAVKGVANKIKNFLHFSRPDEGPLREYQEWMPDMMQGLALGIKQNMKLVKSAVSDLAAAMVPGIDLSPALSQYKSSNLQMPSASENTYNGSSANGKTGSVFNITFNVSQMNNDYDVRRAAEIMAEEIDRLTQDNSSLRGAWSV